MTDNIRKQKIKIIPFKIRTNDYERAWRKIIALNNQYKLEMYLTSIILHLSSSPCRVNERESWTRDKKYFSTCQKWINWKIKKKTLSVYYEIVLLYRAVLLCVTKLKNKPRSPLRIPKMKYNKSNLLAKKM